MVAKILPEKAGACPDLKMWDRSRMSKNVNKILESPYKPNQDAIPCNGYLARVM